MTGLTSTQIAQTLIDNDVEGVKIETKINNAIAAGLIPNIPTRRFNSIRNEYEALTAPKQEAKPATRQQITRRARLSNEEMEDMGMGFQHADGFIKFNKS